MKSLLMSGALAVLVAAPAYGLAPLMTDDFGYGAAGGNLTTLTGNWVAHSGVGAGWVGYQTLTLSLAGYGFGGTGGAAWISNVTGGEDINRSIGGAQAGDVYVSALVNISAASANGSYFLHFKDATTGFRCRVFAQNVGSALRFGLHSTSTGTYSPTDFAYFTTYLLVLHYNGTSGLTALHVLTTVPATEPAVPLLSQTDATPVTTMEALAIRQGSGASGTPTAVIDGIRVGTTWADLLPVELMSLEVK